MHLFDTGLAGRRAKLNLQLQTWLTWLRSEGKSSLLLVFKHEPKFSECLLQSQAQKQLGLSCKGCSVAPTKSQTRNFFTRNNTAVSRAASWSRNIMLCVMLWLTKPPAHLPLDSGPWQLPGMELHVLMEMSLCHGHQDLPQLIYTASPCKCSCPDFPG